MLSLFIGNEFFITDDAAAAVITTPLRANDVRHDYDDRKTVSHHSSKCLSLNSLFLQSLGDEDGIASMVIIHLAYLLVIILLFCRK